MNNSKTKPKTEGKLFVRGILIQRPCNYCGREYIDTMCKLHPASCKFTEE